MTLLAAPEGAPSEPTCPCAGIDPECWERHPVCAEQVPASSPPAATATPPPEPTFVTWPRRGLVLRASSGITQCAQPFCDAIAMGGLARFDVAYRLGYYSIFATVSGGGGVLDVPDFVQDGEPVTNIHGGLTFMFAGAGLMVHPVDLGRVDPWLGVALGYSRIEERMHADQGSTITVISRAGVEVGGGLDVFVHRRLALGPRFDVVFPFGGSVCTGADCINVADLVSADLSAQRRATRRSLPRPWSLTVNFTVFVL
jgi:hypothetical protein